MSGHRKPSIPWEAFWWLSPRRTTHDDSPYDYDGNLLRNGGKLFAIGLPVSAMAFLGLGIGGACRGNEMDASNGGRGILYSGGAAGGCGSKKSTSTTGTPAGTYIITVNATSGTAVRTTTVTLVVQ